LISITLAVASDVRKTGIVPPGSSVSLANLKSVIPNVVERPLPRVIEH